MKKHDATQKIKNLLLYETQEEVSKKIGITRPTLNSRLRKSNWKVSEIYLISKL